MSNYRSKNGVETKSTSILISAALLERLRRAKYVHKESGVSIINRAVAAELDRMEQSEKEDGFQQQAAQ